MNQNERLDYLVKRFLDDSERYKGMEVADDLREKRTVLRSLMNIRMPGLMDEESLRIQDEYLQARIAENGIVDSASLPTMADLGSAVAQADHIVISLRAKYGRDYEQPTAVPMLTDGYNLPAKHVIHIVGPIVQGPLTKHHEEDLAACYRNTLDMCLENGLRSVAFCCISTGVFHFPNKRAAMIAVQTVQEWLEMHPTSVDRVIFNVFKDEDKEYYEQQFV